MEDAWLSEAKRRASAPEQARAYRQRGHDDAERFAQAIGMRHYRNDPQAKKDVIDPSGDAHSVKSGEVKWQLFLYGRSRFLDDDGFVALNGVGLLLVHCIDAFPPDYEAYQKNKMAAKIRLQTPMRELKDRFQRKALLRAFLMKSIFNGGEVNYLTVVEGDEFHVFANTDVVSMMGEAFEVRNSKANPKIPGQVDDQKVLFRYDNRNIAELEMRTDSPRHYPEVRFNMYVQPARTMLKDKLGPAQPCPHCAQVFMYGEARKRFWRWTIPPEPVHEDASDS